MAVRILFNGSPASQTLIVPSRQPETIVLPSGEKATEAISRLWAFSLLALSSRVPANEGGRVSEASEWQVEFCSTAHLRPKR